MDVIEEQTTIKDTTEPSLLKAKKKKNHIFEIYISKVLKQISEDSCITINAKQQLNSALCIILKHISMDTIKLTIMGKKKTIYPKEIENALKLNISGELLANSIIEGEKSCVNFSATEKNNSSRQNKAGILFPPSIIEKFLRNFGYSKIMINGLAPTYLAAVLEYIASEILDISVSICKENKHVRITIRDLELAVRNDKELNLLFTKLNLSFLGGGVVPFIHSSLLNKKRKLKKKTDTNAKTHRFRYGTIAIRNIKKQQKISDCLVLSKAPFEKLVRSILKKNADSQIKISKEVFIILQYFIEQYTVHILHNANFLAIHANRVKLIPNDIDLVIAIMNNDNFSNPYLTSKDKINLFSLDDENDDTEDIDLINVDM